MTWTAKDEARLKKFAQLGARWQRLQQRMDDPPPGLTPMNRIPADALAVYNLANARYQARFHDGGEIAADQLIRARHRARFGTETTQ